MDESRKLQRITRTANDPTRLRRGIMVFVADPDNLTRILAAVGAAAGFGSLIVSMLTYRRGRPKVTIVDLSITQRVTIPWQVSAILVNHSQVAIPLMKPWKSRTSAWKTDNHPRMIVDLVGKRSVVRRVAIADSSMPTQLEPFGNILIEANLDEDPYRFWSEDGRLRKARLRVVLATGLEVRSGWILLLE